MVNNAPPFGEARHLNAGIGAKIAANAKGFARSGQHQNAQVGVIIKIAAESHHFMMHAIVDGVHFFRTIKRHNDHAIVAAINGHALIIFLFKHSFPQWRLVCPQATG
jgi:hypothetical protein